MEIVFDGVKGGLFEGNRLLEVTESPREGVERALLSCSSSQIEANLKLHGIPFEILEDRRQAYAYGALKHFPNNCCIVVDIAKDLLFTFVTRDGKIERDETFPNLPEDTSVFGIYFGVLGAIERMIAELRANAESSTSVMVVGTGNVEPFREDLSELVDLIDPHLTLVGLHEILKEKK